MMDTCPALPCPALPCEASAGASEGPPEITATVRITVRPKPKFSLFWLGISCTDGYASPNGGPMRSVTGSVTGRRDEDSSLLCVRSSFLRWAAKTMRSIANASGLAARAMPPAPAICKAVRVRCHCPQHIESSLSLSLSLGSFVLVESDGGHELATKEPLMIPDGAKPRRYHSRPLCSFGHEPLEASQ